VAACDGVEIVAAGLRGWADPHGTASVVLAVGPDELVEAWAAELPHVLPVDGGAWLERWRRAGVHAVDVIDAELLSTGGPSEPGVVRTVVATMPADAHLVVSSSMPIRDLEWYVAPERRVAVHANRGANGIDGVVSTAVGVAAASGAPTVLVIGDVAFLHDSNGLLGAAGRGVDLVAVVIDNDGGGIFSFLPQGAALETEVFEQLYGTPHGLDLVALASAYGVTARAADDLGPALDDALAVGGVHVLVVRTERTANLELHRRLNAAVADALSAAKTDPVEDARG
jgi:2-succinyl-5-enolpyruvyl-6-hydroxy-3-cyclohexene-1-carboxylate synthase